jgi:phosphoheptose isomerase
LIGAIEQAASICIAVNLAGKEILVAGNGGSAAHEQHLAAGAECLQPRCLGPRYGTILVSLPGVLFTHFFDLLRCQ